MTVQMHAVELNAARRCALEAGSRSETPVVFVRANFAEDQWIVGFCVDEKPTDRGLPWTRVANKQRNLRATEEN